MNRFSVISFILLLGMGAIFSTTAKAVTPIVSVTLDTPVDGITIHTYGLFTAPVGIGSSNHYVKLTGNPFQQITGVTWRMWIAFEGNTPVAADNDDNQTITLNSSDVWIRNASNTGSLSGMAILFLGSHYAEAYSSISAPGAGLRETRQINYFDVVNP